MRTRTQLFGITTTTVAMFLLMGAVTAAMAGDCTMKCCMDKTAAAAAADQTMNVKAEVNAEALKTLMDLDVSMVLVDARGAQKAWITGAVAISPDADDQTIRTALGDPQQLVVTYCGGPGCAMSLNMANRLAQLGYTHVIRFTGGMAKWSQAGFEFASAEMATPMQDESAQASGPATSAEGS